MLLAHVDGANPWEYHAHLDVWLLIASIVLAYWWAVTRLGPRHAPPGRPPVTRRNVLCFAAGVAFLWGFADWPVHEISEGYLFWVHMVQHTVFSLVAPPLLLLGTPTWLLRLIVRPAWLRAVVGRLARPLPGLLLFNGVVAVSHAAAWVDFTLRNELAHFAAHTLLFTVAVIMWLPVVNRLPGVVRTVSYPVRMIYLFGQSILPNVPAAFLVFAERPIYRFYAEAPRAFGLSAVEDQQIAAAVMKIGGTTIIWGVIIGMFFHWYTVSQRDKGDVLTWDDVERELSRTSPARP